LSDFNVLAVGDVVGSPGRRAVRELLPGLREAENVDLVVLNAENAAGGSGLTPEIVADLLDAGCDCLTTGDHVYKNRAVMEVIDSEPRLVRPANISTHAAGRGYTVLETGGGPRVAVINLLGRAFIGPADNPFTCVERLLAGLDGASDLVLIDFHAEATAEKVAMGHFLDGRVAALWGTHTHVATADERVLPGGTGYITDIGMTGGHEGVIGRRAAEVIEHLRTDMPTRWDIAKVDVRISGALFAIDAASGRCNSVRRVQVKLE